MSDKVTDWLDRIELGQYAAAFKENAIDWELLPDVDQETLKDIGVKAAGHRLRILRALSSLQDAATNTVSAHETSVFSPDVTDSNHHLAAWERQPGERRPVTMLFADIVGSTALTEHLDAEETHEVLYGAIQRMCAAVEANRGTVCRFMGDGVMAMFGAPVASERHAVDACEAALAMQRAIEEHGDTKKPNQSGLTIRVGLHSGEVVVLTIGAGENLEYDASGPTVPIAARMEQAAPAGGIYLTTATHELAIDYIEVDAVESLLVKGISEPISVFSLHRVKSTEEAGRDRTRTPFVGRRSEIVQFRGSLDLCLEAKQGQIVYLRGDPGIGKTRLVEEFSRIGAAKGIACHRGLVLPFGVGKGQDAIRSLVRGLLGVALGSGKAARQDAVEEALGAGYIAPDQAVFLNDLLDVPQPAEQQARYDAMENSTRNDGKQAVVSNLVRNISSRRPLLCIVEDVHWAEPQTLSHLAELARTVADCPALLILTSRIEGDQLDRQWLGSIGGSPFLTIELGPLRPKDSIALIGEFIDAADPLAKRCLERAAGNPLFLEQLLRNAKEGTTGNLPDSIHSLVLARMDRLEPQDKRALQAASVIGQRFDANALRQLLGNDEYDLSQLVQHNLVRVEGGSFLFAHALIQESVYGSLVKSQRHALHRDAARWFEGRDLVLHAEHLGCAEDANAPHAYLQAAQEQAAQYRLEKALALSKRGLEADPDKRDAFLLQCLQGELLRTLGLTVESIKVFRAAKDTADSAIGRCRASIGIAEGLRILEAYDELLEEVRYAEAIAIECNLFFELARVNQLRSGVYFFRGEIEACLEASTAALKYVEEEDSPETKAQILSGLGDAEYLRGRMISACRYFDECVAISREHALRRILAANLSMRADTYRYQAKHALAMADFEEAISLARDNGHLRAEMIALESDFLVDSGNLDLAAKWANRRLTLARQLGSRNLAGFSLASLARVAFANGAQHDAECFAQDAIDTIRDGGMAFLGPIALGALALITLDPDRRDAALSEAEDLLRGNSVSHNFLRFYPDAMEVCLRMKMWNEVDRCAQALEDYTAAEPLPLTDFYIARGHALARFGRGNRDATTIQQLQHLQEQATGCKLMSAVPALQAALSVI